MAKSPNRDFSKENIQMDNKPMKRYLTLLHIKKMQINNITAYYFTPTRMTIIKSRVKHVLGWV